LLFWLNSVQNPEVSDPPKAGQAQQAAMAAPLPAKKWSSSTPSFHCPLPIAHCPFFLTFVDKI
jgi:hypothetical protein